jgi:hypothetical protein
MSKMRLICVRYFSSCKSAHLYGTCNVLFLNREPQIAVVNGWAVSAAACHVGGLGSIPGPGQTYV